MVLNHVRLPVLDCAVSLDLLGLQVHVFDVHPRILSEVAELNLVEFLRK